MKEGFRLSHEPSPKPLQIDRDVSNCEGCELLDSKISSFPRCKRLDKPIAQIKVCETGPMVRIPTSIAELVELKEKLRLLHPETFPDFKSE